jgi:hypothetical protein
MTAMPKLLPAAAALAAALILAGVAAADQIRAVPRLPAGWSHAEINVIVKGTPHTLVYDRGRVLAVSATSLTLREQDGSVQTISVSASSQVTIAGQPASLSQIRLREIAITLRIDGADATRVTVRIPPAVAVEIAREQKAQRRR